MNKDLPAGLLGRIISAIGREKELRCEKREKMMLFSFLILLAFSFSATPFSLMIFLKQAESSGIFYFVSAAASDLNVFFSLWQDFGLAILESLPILGIIALALSIGMFLFSVRWLIYNKKLINFINV